MMLLILYVSGRHTLVSVVNELIETVLKRERSLTVYTRAAHDSTQS